MPKIKTDQPAKYEIINIEKLTHDTGSFKFKLPDEAALDFLPGDHMMMHAAIDGQDQVRPYTPASTPDDTGFFEMIIKRYPEGIMSRYIHDRQVGDQVSLVGPTKGGHFDKGMADTIGMIAGGAGITPMISIIRTVIRRGYDVKMTLLFANKTIDDIILHEEFAAYAREHANFDCYFTLDDPPAGWTGLAGFINDDKLQKYPPSPDTDPIIFLCGPPMMEYKIRQTLLSLGYDKSRLVIP